MEDIDELKRRPGGRPRYRLARADVYVSGADYHYFDYLDPVETLSPAIDAAALTADKVDYIEKTRHANRAKFRAQADAVFEHVPRRDVRIIDVGCGGGLFLSLVKKQGARVTGVELNDARAQYALSRYGVAVIKRPLEDRYWEQYTGAYDVCTLWDVIEHVNFPRATVERASKLLKKEGGILLVDTPCRDSFYHRAGQLTYRLSFGRYPTFLNAMYSARPYGHKQIFSTKELEWLFEAAGLEVVQCRKFHELSFPYMCYLQRIFKSRRMARILLPAMAVLLRVFPVKNIMLIVGRKR